MILYRALGLTAREAAEIMADIAEMIEARMSDEEIARRLAEKYSGLKLSFAALTLGRLIGMSFGINEPDKAKAILADFRRFIEILRKDGKEKLVRVIEKEILEETYKDVERLKDAF